MIRALGLPLALAAGLAGPAPGAAEPARPATLFLSGQATTIEGAEDGGGGGLEWLQPVGATASATIGGYGYALGGSRWGYGKLGGILTLGGRTTLAGDLSVGAGEHTTTGRSFGYQIYRAEVTYAVVDRVLYATLEDLYSDVDEARDNLVRVGVAFYPDPSLGLRLSYHRSTAGNVDSSLVSGRVDLTTRWGRLFAGFLVGETSPEKLNLIPRGPDAIEAQEYYVGVAIPVGRQELTLILDTTRVEDAQKFTALVVWKIPF